MPETRFTEFSALSVDPRVGIFSVCIGDRCFLFFLTYDIKNYYLSFVVSFRFDILRHITIFSERIRCFRGAAKNDVSPEI